MSAFAAEWQMHLCVAEMRPIVKLLSTLNNYYEYY